MSNRHGKPKTKPDFLKNRAEYTKTFNFLVKTTVDVLGISEQEAGMRVSALLKTDLLSGDPNDPFTQYRIDKFLAIPSRNHNNPLPFLLQSGAYRDAFAYTLTNLDVISEYERISGVSRGTIAQQKLGDAINIDTASLTGPLADFEKFFRRSVWARFLKSDRQ